MAYVIKEKRRTCCTCGRQDACVSPGAALRSTGFFHPFPIARQMQPPCRLVPQRVPEPFYDGPCGTETEVPCCCQSNDFYPTYAYFSQFTPFSLEPGDAIPFTGDFNISPTGVRIEGDSIFLSQPGTYTVSYMLNIPAGTPADTTFSFLVDGVEVPGMTISVSQDESEGGKQAFAQAIITTDRTVLLELVSSEAVSFTGDSVIATLSLHRIA